MKTNDITIASFPKSGVTYLGYLLVAARAIHNHLDIRPNFFNIDWLLVDDSKMKGHDRPTIWRDGMGDFLKTHSNAYPAPNVIFLLRNPVDTLKSFYFFMKQGYGFKGSPREFLDGKDGISRWLAHLDSWIRSSRSPSQSVMVVQYEDLVTAPAEHLDLIYTSLGQIYEPEVFARAIQWASLQNMRRLEALFTSRNPAYQQFQLDFVRKTDRREVPEWLPEYNNYINARCGAAYMEVVAKLPKLESTPSGPWDQ